MQIDTQENLKIFARDWTIHVEKKEHVELCIKIEGKKIIKGVATHILIISIFWINFEIISFSLKNKISINMLPWVACLKKKVLVKCDSLDFTLLGSVYGDTGCCKSQDKLKGFSIIIVVITSIVHTLLASQGNIVRALISINFQEKGTRRLLNNKKCECVHS